MAHCTAVHAYMCHVHVLMQVRKGLSSRALQWNGVGIISCLSAKRTHKQKVRRRTKNRTSTSLKRTEKAFVPEKSENIKMQKKVYRVQRRVSVIRAKEMWQWEYILVCVSVRRRRRSSEEWYVKDRTRCLLAVIVNCSGNDYIWNINCVQRIWNSTKERF